MGSDTLGEDSLQGSPYYGYDIVTGAFTTWRHSAEVRGRRILRCYSLYHQINTWNVLGMLLVLLEQRPDLRAREASDFLRLRDRLARAIRDGFARDGVLRSLMFRYDDGGREWRGFGDEVDFWEHVWALAQGPFWVDPGLLTTSARQVREQWWRHLEEGRRGPGNCPWNVLARFLRETGLSSAAFSRMLEPEVRAACHTPIKYPLRGALVEDLGNPDSWRALPFSAGSFLLAHASLALQGLPQGLAVRGSPAVRRVGGFRYRQARIDVELHGEGDDVAGYRLNGKSGGRCLQVCQAWLRPGLNTLEISRGEPAASRILGSDAELLELTEDARGVTALFRSALPLQIRFEGGVVPTVGTPEGRALRAVVREIPGVTWRVLETAEPGEVSLHLPG
jgi:hypothetical protein